MSQTDRDDKDDGRVGLDVDEATSQRLSKQKQKNTTPELQVRQILRDLGHHYRVENRELPGSPDVANRSRGWAVFVHGCYWHHHEGCDRATVPKRNRKFWMEKFRRNRARDREAIEALEELGMDVVVVWECELETDLDIVRRLKVQLPRPPKEK